MIRHCVGTAIAVLFLLPTARADELADLLMRVPGDMNTVAVVNVREINKTPRAVREKWRDNHETEYLAGAIAVPAWVPVVVVGADLHPGALASGHSLALIPVDNAVNSETIAKRENGVVQSIGDRSVVLSPTRGYIGVPTAGILGISSNLPRQEFARWFRFAQKPDKPVISQFLQDTVAAHKDAHILIATDLEDLFDPTAVRVALQQSGAVRGDAALDSLVRVLTGARGLVFTAKIDDKTTATFRIEFAVPMADFAAQFKDLWPKAMEAAGFEVEEFKTADMRADGKALVWTAELSDTSLRRILSLVSAPGDAVGSKDGSTGPIKTPKEAAVVSASLRYYRAVNSALDDLKTQGGAKGKDYTRSATFFETYANRIEKLPLTDVDPVLVQYGASVGAKLRAMAGSLRGLKVQLEAYDSYKSTTWATGGPGVFVTPRGRIGLGGGGDVALSTNVEELSKKQAELVAQLEPERAKIWGVLEGDRSAVRREMLEKYKIDFDQYRR
jgi:hypothetical protein